MKKILLVVLLLVGISGCGNSITGVLKLTQNTMFNFQGKGQKMVAYGEYEVEVSQNVNSGYLNIEFQNLWGNSDPDARFYYEGNLRIPDNNGEFSISAEETKQDIGLEGHIETTFRRGRMRRERERCSTEVRRRECFRNRRGVVVCRDVWERAWGYRDVEYEPVTRRKTIDVLLVDLNDMERGSFFAQDVETFRDYTYESRCRAR